jgi:hypothetical protein
LNPDEIEPAAAITIVESALETNSPTGVSVRAAKSQFVFSQPNKRTAIILPTLPNSFPLVYFVLVQSIDSSSSLTGGHLCEFDNKGVWLNV